MTCDNHLQGCNIKFCLMNLLCNDSIVGSDFSVDNLRWFLSNNIDSSSFPTNSSLATNVLLISSKNGNAKFIVKINDDIKKDCAFFFAGNKNVNYLTPAAEDESSFSAMYQEVLVEIELS